MRWRFPDVRRATQMLNAPEYLLSLAALALVAGSLTIGAVRFDLSIMVLLLVAFIGMQLAFGAAA